MSHRRAMFALFILTMIIAFWMVRSYVSLDTLVVQEAWLRHHTATHPIAVLSATFVGYIVLSLIPGLTGKSVFIGWLLGFLPGLLVVNGGLTVAAVIMFLVSRHFVREAVQCKLGWLIHRLNHGLQESDGSYLLILRLLHTPFTLTNYAVGATNVGVRRFWWTTQLGLLPGNIAFVFAGASLPSLRELSEVGVWGVISIPLLVSLTLIGMLPVMIRWCVKRCRSTGPRMQMHGAAKGFWAARRSNGAARRTAGDSNESHFTQL